MRVRNNIELQKLQQYLLLLCVALHHWLWRRNGQIRGTGVFWYAKNQMWNLMPMKSQALHTSIHGWGKNSFGPFGKFWYGTPQWFKSGLYSTGGRIDLKLSE